MGKLIVKGVGNNPHLGLQTLLGEIRILDNLEAMMKHLLPTKFGKFKMTEELGQELKDTLCTNRYRFKLDIQYNRTETEGHNLELVCWKGLIYYLTDKTRHEEYVIISDTLRNDDGDYILTPDIFKWSDK